MINVYIGENGCGKSRLLGELAKSRIDIDDVVFAISNTIAHKFPPKKKRNSNYFFFEPLNELNSKKNFYYSKQRPIIKEAFTSATGNDSNDMHLFISQINMILSYIGYDPIIGLKLDLEPAFQKRYVSSVYRDNDEIENNIIDSILSHANRLSDYSDRVIWLDESNIYNFKFLEGLASILQAEKKSSRKLNFCNINLFLRKNGEEFQFNSASSGEVTLISTALFLATHLQNFKNQKISILIDEPENSLHPKWQRQYVENLKNIFPYYDFEFHIATHSPIFIAGAQKEGAVLHRHNGNKFEELVAETSNIEDALIDQFGIVTPQNHSLSERCIDLINDVDGKKLSSDEALKTLSKFIESSFDEQQKEFLVGVADLIKNLSSGKFNGKN